jgi:ubiquinone/menaquinone biosynthesis C-methylase UbiE
MESLAESEWSRPETVASFTRSAPNEVLLRFAERQRAPAAFALDLGCGAGRNAIPLVRSGWHVIAVDLSWPMIAAAASRAREENLTGRLESILGAMDQLPIRPRSIDLVIAHGIWNLARSAAEFRRAIREAARVARPGAGLFVFTFSRNTLPPGVEPVAGEPFVFTQFSGQPQCFLTDGQLVSEMASAGFAVDPTVPLTEYNRPRPGALATGAVPVIYEAAFRFSGDASTTARSAGDV